MKSIFPIFSFGSWRTYLGHLRHYGIALFIFLIGLFLSLGAFRFYRIQDINRTSAEFSHIADVRLFLLKDIFLATLEQLEYIKQFYLASTEVTQQDFSTFVREIFNHYPNYLALGWLDKEILTNPSTQTSVSLNFLNLDQQDKSGSSKFFPLTYFETSKLHENFYIDSSEYKTFLDLLNKSQTSLETIISDNVTYVQNNKKQGFFLFRSIFSEGSDITSPKTGLLGIILGFSNFEDIVENIRFHVGHTGISISIYDVSQGDNHLIYGDIINTLKDPLEPTSEELEQQVSWTRNQIFKFGNRIWKLQAAPTIEFIRLNQNLYSHWEILMIGILISAIMSSYFLVLANRRILIEQEVRDRTNELANINNILQQEIHDRQRIEEEFIENQKYLQRRHEALEYLTKQRTSELRKALHEVILRTAVVMQVDRVGVWLYKIIDETQILSCSGLYTLSTNAFSNHLEITSTHFPRYFEVLSKYSHLVLPSPQDSVLNQELSSYLAVFHIHSKLDIPIVFEGHLLGILSCEETRGHREWVLEDRHFCQTIADVIAIMIEQSARRKAEKALKESEERLRFIRQYSIDGIISINDREEIISWNYGAQQMFGYNEMEILGKSLRMIIPQDEVFLKHEVSSKPIELQGRHRDGHLFSVEISQTRWKNADIYFDTMIIRDITERKEYEKRLIKAIRDAKAANAAKSEFLATISHELRTPLNAIIGFNQCLLIGMDGPVNEAQEESLKKIEKSSFHLLNLINDILDWSKIEAKKLELEIEPQNIVEIITSCVEDMQSIAQQKNLEIHLSINQLFILVEFDRMRIRQVILNLLSNAVKFTTSGSILVNLIHEPYQVHIQVIDTGIGLTPEEIDKIFRPFSQADSSITRKYGGTGLGLIISKNIIDLHGGSITVESQKGKGSIFTITLPKSQ